MSQLYISLSTHSTHEHTPTQLLGNLTVPNRATSLQYWFADRWTRDSGNTRIGCGCLTRNSGTTKARSKTPFPGWWTRDSGNTRTGRGWWTRDSGNTKARSKTHSRHQHLINDKLADASAYLDSGATSGTVHTIQCMITEDI